MGILKTVQGLIELSYEKLYTTEIINMALESEQIFVLFGVTYKGNI